MNALRRRTANEEGVVLVLAIFFLTAGSLMVLGLLNLSFAGAASSRALGESMEKHYAGEAAVTRAVAALRDPANANKMQPADPYTFFPAADGRPGCPGLPEEVEQGQTKYSQVTLNGTTVRVECAALSGTLGQVSVLIVACPDPAAVTDPDDDCDGSVIRATATFTQDNDPTKPTVATITSWSTRLDGSGT